MICCYLFIFILNLSLNGSRTIAVPMLTINRTFLSSRLLNAPPCSNPLCSRLLGEHPANTRLLSAGQFSLCHSADVHSRLHTANGKKQKDHQNALKSSTFDGGGVQNKNANPDTHCIKISVLMWQRTLILIEMHPLGLRGCKLRVVLASVTVIYQ